ncbi:MAG: 50S ribosomal protein L11 methyltransferase [Desulfocapsa sp.]|nr:50S ribosomal protein L11 methyltransferase [Desulfocapsa sp.]
MPQHDKTPYWLKAHIEMHPILEEAAVDFLVGVMGAGVEQSVDTPGAEICLNVYLKEKSPDEQSRHELQHKLEAQFHELASIFQVAAPQISWEQIEDQDWSNNWKVHFKPFVITPGLVIAPTWEEYTAGEGELVIVMDPGMAFGTGHHATTSLSLHLISRILADDTKGSVLDVGCGTGILGMGAALFGATHVLGIDNDPEAVRAAKENVTLNNLNPVMEVALTPLQDLEGPFDLIVANIIHDVLLTMADDLWRLSKNGGSLVLSGILHGEQEASIICSFEKTGFSFVDSEQKEEWAALHFTKNT